MATDESRARIWTVRELLAWSRNWLEERGVESPRLTAEMLLSHTLDCQRIRLYVDIDRPLQKDELARYKELIRRRAAGEPVQYVVGATEFYGRRLRCDRRALIPRPETELVVERALRALPRDLPVRVADIGCGSGTLGLTIAAERPLAHVVLLDISDEALALTAENAAALGVTDRVTLLQGDLAAPLSGHAPFDAVVTNLPYIPDSDRAQLEPHIREHEPALALFGGADGLSLYRRLVPQLASLVRPGGIVVAEHGEGHAESLSGLFDAAIWNEATAEKDLAGLWRFSWAIRSDV